jgi:hypothetical protein
VSGVVGAMSMSVVDIQFVVSVMRSVNLADESSTIRVKREGRKKKEERK